MENWVIDPLAEHTVENFILYLASVCDRAHSQDHNGFSGGDVDFGHAMADRITVGKPLSVKMAMACIKMVRKYHRQLGGKDFITEWLKAPVFQRSPLGFGEEVKPANNRILYSQDKTAVFKSPFDQKLINDIKDSIRGEYKGQKYFPKWDAAHKVWTVPVNESSIFKIIALAQKYNFDIEQRFLDYYAKVEEKLGEHKIMLTLNDGQNISVSDDSIMIAVDNLEILGEIQNILKN